MSGYCKHWQNNRQVPCPAVCPYQNWPKYMFRRTLFTARWKFRKKYQHLDNPIG